MHRSEYDPHSQIGKRKVIRTYERMIFVDDLALLKNPKSAQYLSIPSVLSIHVIYMDCCLYILMIKQNEFPPEFVAFTSP